jgi:hypothetical protein
MKHPAPSTRPSSATRVLAGGAPLFPTRTPATSSTAPCVPGPCGDALHGPALRQSHPTNSP